MRADELPVLFFDQPFPDVYADLVEGRAVVVGPDLADLAGAAAVIAGVRKRWDAAAIAEAPTVKVISRVGVGYDSVDVAAATAAGVVVCNTPLGPTVSTAEHTVALMMALARDLAAQQARAREGLPGVAVGTAMELDGRSLGLVGLGRIGRRVAHVANALGMHVLAHDPLVADVDDVTMVTLDELWASSDIVSLHAPATPATYHLVNDTTLAAMRPGVLLINCARGGLVDHDALLRALDSGHLGGAALDVTEPEPLPAGHPLLSHPRVIVTPHVASNTVAGRRRLYSMAIDNALAVLEGRPASVVTA